MNYDIFLIDDHVVAIPTRLSTMVTQNGKQLFDLHHGGSLRPPPNVIILEDLTLENSRRNYTVLKLKVLIGNTNDSLIDHQTLTDLFEYFQVLTVSELGTPKKWGINLIHLEGENTGVVFGIPLRDLNTLNRPENCARDFSGYQQSKGSAQFYNIPLQIRITCLL